MGLTNLDVIPIFEEESLRCNNSCLVSVLSVPPGSVTELILASRHLIVPNGEFHWVSKSFLQSY
jgi:hypothetical protein